MIINYVVILAVKCPKTLVLVQGSMVRNPRLKRGSSLLFWKSDAARNRSDVAWRQRQEASEKRRQQQRHKGGGRTCGHGHQTLLHHRHRLSDGEFGSSIASFLYPASRRCCASCASSSSSASLGPADTPSTEPLAAASGRPSSGLSSAASPLYQPGPL